MSGSRCDSARTNARNVVDDHCRSMDDRLLLLLLLMTMIVAAVRSAAAVPPARGIPWPTRQRPSRFFCTKCISSNAGNFSDSQVPSAYCPLWPPLLSLLLLFRYLQVLVRMSKRIGSCTARKTAVAGNRVATSAAPAVALLVRGKLSVLDIHTPAVRGKLREDGQCTFSPPPVAGVTRRRTRRECMSAVL
jgi:hypothetical protein